MNNDDRRDRVFTRQSKMNTTDGFDTKFVMRSTMLRDPIAILIRLGVEDDVDRMVMGAMSVPSLLTALRRAKEKEALTPCLELAATGTWARYMQSVATLMRDGKGDAFAAYRRRLSDPALCKNTRQALRSPLIRYAALVVENLAPTVLEHLRVATDAYDTRIVDRVLRNLGTLSRDRSTADLPPMALSSADITLLGRAIVFLEETSVPATSPKSTPPGTAKQKRGSKRAAVTALNRLQKRRRRTDPGFDWRDEVWRFTQLSDLPFQTKILIAVLMATGCRTAELVHREGLQIALSRDSVLITISGCKVKRSAEGRPASGQERRSLRLSVTTPELRWLSANLPRPDLALRMPNFDTRVSSDGQRFAFVVSHHEKSAGREHSVASQVANALKKIGEAAFPRLKARLSPNCFRHASASDLKAAQCDLDEIAKALGHQSERTQQGYGHARQAGPLSPRASRFISASATDPVRTASLRGPRLPKP